MAKDTTITTKTLEELYTEAEGYAAAYMKANRDNDLAARDEAEACLKDIEGKYAAKSENIVLTKCRDSENPMLEGVKTLQYPILSHRFVKVDGLVTDIELSTERVRRIDLVRLAEFCKLPVVWKYKVENAGALLAYRAAKELGMTPTAFARLKREYWMSDIARREKLGETPTSNSQVCKLLQTVIDAIMFEDDGNGKNKYKVVSKHVAYMLDCYTRGGSSPLEVKVSKASYITGLFLDILHTIVCDAQFKLTGYKVGKDSDRKPAAKTAAPAPAEEVLTPETTEASSPAEEVLTPEAVEDMPSMDEIPEGAVA